MLYDLYTVTVDSLFYVSTSILQFNHFASNGKRIKLPSPNFEFTPV